MNSKPKTKNSKLVAALLDWFAANARDLPWRRTRDPYAIWVSEIMLQQTQVKTVVPFWERWMRELPTIEAVAKASPDKIHKLWEGLGYYTRARNLQKAAQQIVNRRRDEFHESPSKNKVRDSQRSSLQFPEKFDDVLALPGIGRYTAGAICSIAFNQPTPILDGNVIRVLTRIFGIAQNPKEKKTNAQLWRLAEDLVSIAGGAGLRRAVIFNFGSTESRPTGEQSCSHLNQSLMELGALVCTPRNPQCKVCPVKTLCVAFKQNRVDELPNLGKRETATARRFIAFVVQHNGKYLVRQRPAGIVNAHLWEFPNIEVTDAPSSHPSPPTGEKVAEGRLRGNATVSNSFDQAAAAFQKLFGAKPKAIQPLRTVKHSITRYRITLEAFRLNLGGTNFTSPYSKKNQSGTRRTRPSENHFAKRGIWKSPAQMRQLAFTAAHKRIFSHLKVSCSVCGRNNQAAGPTPQLH